MKQTIQFLTELVLALALAWAVCATLPACTISQSAAYASIVGGK